MLKICGKPGGMLGHRWGRHAMGKWPNEEVRSLKREMAKKYKSRAVDYRIKVCKPSSRLFLYNGGGSHGGLKLGPRRNGERIRPCIQ
jgi:hypothetical protein